MPLQMDISLMFVTDLKGSERALKNGKIFGKINLVDFLVIIGVIVAIIGIFVRFVLLSENSHTENSSFEYVVKVDNVRDCTIQGLEKKGSLYFGKDNAYVGEIVDVEFKTAEYDLVMDNGERKLIERPDRYTALVKIQSAGTKTEGRFSDAAERDIAVGGTLAVCSKYVNTTGQIVDFKLSE